MPNDLSKKYFNKLWPIDLYKFTSFLASMLVWPAFYFGEENFLSHAHFATIFLLGNGYVYFNTYGLSNYLKHSGLLPFYFLFQIVSLIGIGYSHNVNSFIYLASMPIVMGMYYYSVINAQNNSFKESRSILIYTLGFCSFLLFESFKKGEFINYSELVALATFGVWTFFSAYWGFELHYKGQRNFLSRLFSKSNTTKVTTTKFDRMFFHDMVNHTHALMLFLRSKRNTNDFEASDIENTINEVKLLQENLHQHFGFKHKDISRVKSTVPFQIALARVYSLVDAYFPQSDQVKIHLGGYLSGSQDLSDIRRCQVDIIAFHRIMTNILKNAYEAGSQSIDCYFDYKDDGLYVSIKNSMHKLDHGKMNLEEDLGAAILSFDKRSTDHLGLESITQITNEIGGNFHFFVKDGLWHNEFYLPSDSLKDQSKKAA